jgi:glycosyltransferase involved in cell wall biosynthesis
MVGEGLRARGHQVRTVFMYRKTSAYDTDPHADFILKTRPAGLPGQMRAAAGLIGYMRREKPDAVISYQHYGNIFGTFAARLAGARHVVANQSGAPQTRGVMGLLSSIDKVMGVLGLYQLNVVNSAWTQAQFDRYPAAYRRRMRRIDHGVPGPAKAYDRRAARKAFGLPQDVWLAVSTGRLTPQKNHVALVGALCRLEHLHVAIAGAGPERETLTAFAIENGVADRLHFVGEVAPAQIFEFLAAGDVFAFPSVNETFGLSAAEAAIAGLPVVANGLPVLREVLTTDSREPAALFVEDGDAGGFAEALAAMRETPGLAEKLASNGRLLAERYSPAAMCLAYENLLG